MVDAILTTHTSCSLDELLHWYDDNFNPTGWYIHASLTISVDGDYLYLSWCGEQGSMGCYDDYRMEILQANNLEEIRQFLVSEKAKWLVKTPQKLGVDKM